VDNTPGPWGLAAFRVEGRAMIIDTHVHVLSFPSLRDLGDKIRTTEDVIGFRTRHPEIYRASLTEHPVDNSDDLIAAMDAHGIAQALVQARPGPTTNRQVAEAARRHPGRLAALLRIGHDQEALGYVDDPAPVREKAPQEIAHCIEELGMIGVGEIFIRALTNEIHPEKIARDLDSFMGTVARYRVPIQFPTAWSQFPGGLYYGNPIWVDEVAQRHPEVPIILTKMGRSITSYFDSALTVALRNANIYFDVVGTSPEHLRVAVDKIGAHRIMFGTDWSATWRWLRVPLDLYAFRLKVVDDAGLSAEDREDILWRTAAGLFKLAV
jgi:hypothetical protein